MINILIIEDDETIVTILKQELEKWGYQISVVDDFNHVMDTFSKENPQLVLMDIILPYFNGYHWCEEIRKISNIPIIFISSRSEKMDIVMGMQIGGDDYITKPIDLDVTVAKIQAVLRRSYDLIDQSDYLKYKNLHLYLGEAKLEYKNDKVSLTRTELKIMESLFRVNGKYVSREKIMEKCWQGDSYIDDSTLSVNINRLRKKLKKINLPDLILTKKNVGYSLSESVAEK